MATRMQQRRGTSSQWTAANPVMASGEIGFETDTNKLKIGDGVNIWANLSYFIDETNLSASLGDYVELASIGVADGVASLDVNGFVPANQLNIDVSGDIDAAISTLIAAAPGTLDTLNELAAALGDDENFSTTVFAAISANSADILANTNAILDNSADIETNVTEIGQRKIEITSSIGSSTSCIAGNRYITTVTSGITLTLPESPSTGDEVQVLDGTGAATSILVARNGNLINGLSEDADLDVAGFAVVFIYTGTTFGWRLG